MINKTVDSQHAGRDNRQPDGLDEVDGADAAGRRRAYRESDPIDLDIAAAEAAARRDG
jgi:hypothetical protein